MNFFKWTSRQVVDDYARAIAIDFSRLCSPPDKRQVLDKAYEKRIESALSEIFEKVRLFRQENALGIFKRARFAKVFQDELLRSGYDAEVTGRVTTALVAAALAGK